MKAERRSVYHILLLDLEEPRIELGRKKVEKRWKVEIQIDHIPIPYINRGC
jgi:hypothetical protein